MTPFVHFPSTGLICPEAVFYDAAFLQAMRLYSYVAAEHSENGPTTFCHLSQTIALLNQKLSQGEKHLIGSALYVVMTLLVMALFYEDWTSAEIHMAGLRKIVGLRGGHAFLQQRPCLYFVIDRWVIILMP